ncbi:MAG TPA: SCP2 sterol-binding domain-containing protein [Steroidobacter sp.]|jgi:predicted lipid carrier protein YhbT|nr:SCP2 sterol-binding domain-containing protein [Steroidobacter sp.]
MSLPSAAFAAWLRVAPTPVHERLLSLTVNHLLRGQPFATRLAELAGKRFRLCVDDAGAAFTFEITPNGLVRSTMPPHVTIRGPVRDFIALALRQEDPDTLFFQRRLAVEGETETGVHLKNLLDGWEYDAPAHVRAVLPGPVAGAVLRARRAVMGIRDLAMLRSNARSRAERH